MITIKREFFTYTLLRNWTVLVDGKELQRFMIRRNEDGLECEISEKCYVRMVEDGLLDGLTS